MKAIILAAGQGKRLYPLTKNQPKCLVKLFGKSIIEWQIEKFDKCNIKNISIVRGYLGDMINFSNINTYENKNYDTTNMVETLFCAKEELTAKKQLINRYRKKNLFIYYNLINIT